MFKIPKQVLEATLNYLAKKPYLEVANLIQALSQAQEEKHIEKVAEKKS